MRPEVPAHFGVSAHSSVEGSAASSRRNFIRVGTTVAATMMVGGIDSASASQSDVFIALAGEPDALFAGQVDRDSTGAPTRAEVVWPDGTAGEYRATAMSSHFPGTVDAYEVTYGQIDGNCPLGEAPSDVLIEGNHVDTVSDDAIVQNNESDAVVMDNVVDSTISGNLVIT